MGDIAPGAPMEVRLARARLEERQSILAYLRRRAEDPALPMVQQVILSDAAGAICRGEHYPRPRPDPTGGVRDSLHGMD